ncbi:MAG TPA: outer membrane protein assembly factor BamD [Gammaproteobacteria bacterium]|nr:outer membrane protein assembly factor BamD [Gammaproteobacteria bacterium]
MRIFSIIVLVMALITLAACKTSEPFAAYKGASAQTIFQNGENSLARGHYEAAVKSFEALDALYPFGDYSQQGQLDIIYAYYKKGDAESALAAADRYIRLYPRDPNVDYAFYMKGLINMGPSDSWIEKTARSELSQRDLTNMQQAFADFNLLIQRFPNSRYVPDARTRMIYIRNLLAQHQLEVAQYYMNYKAYVAAANRANSVVQDYPASPQIIPALAIMVQAYRALGENDMANNALQVLRANYPNSKEAKQLGTASK